MAIKVKDYKTSNGQHLGEVYIQVRAVTIEIDVWDKNHKYLISKEKKTRILGDNVKSKIGYDSYNILKTMGDIKHPEDLFEARTIWEKIVKWMKSLLIKK